MPKHVGDLLCDCILLYQPNCSEAFGINSVNPRVSYVTYLIHKWPPLFLLIAHIKPVKISYASFVINFKFVLSLIFLIIVIAWRFPTKWIHLSSSFYLLHFPTTKYSPKPPNVYISLARYICFPTAHPLLVVYGSLPPYLKAVNVTSILQARSAVMRGTRA